MIDEKKLLEKFNNAKISVTLDLPARVSFGSCRSDLAYEEIGEDVAHEKMMVDMIENVLRGGELILVTHEPDEVSGGVKFTCPLPKEGERVLAVDCRGCITTNKQWMGCDGYYLDNVGYWTDVVAWMPLSKLCQGEEVV